MAFGITHKFKDGKQEHYEAAVEKVHPGDGLPEGQTYHFAGETGDGWVIVAIWDSEESWEKFRDETLNPGLQGLGEAGFPNPPEETTFEIHTSQEG